jgi:amino acid transporter
MLAIAPIIVALWFLPVVFFIILPLFVACLGMCFAMFNAFKPVAGQAVRPVSTGS